MVTNKFNLCHETKNFYQKRRPGRWDDGYIGLQPMSPGWSSFFSPEMIAQLDYVLMDPQTVPLGNGFDETLRIWNYDTYVDDTEYFMEAYMKRYLEVINNTEPITTLGWPLFLPVCITHTPHEEFIMMARKEGLKFTFGSDIRDNRAGRLSYCKEIARKCKLTRDDFYIPQRELPQYKG